jgi:hypothetical protein
MFRVAAISVPLLALLAGCQGAGYAPSLATAAYPRSLHSGDSVPIEVFRDGASIQIVNSTAVDYDHGVLWLNQQFTFPVGSLPAGGRATLDLWSFRDHLGEQFNAGGIWRTDEPTPLVIAELQVSDHEPMVGLIVIHDRQE